MFLHAIFIRRVVAASLDLLILVIGFELYFKYQKMMNPMWWDQLFFGAIVMIGYIPVIIFYPVLWELISRGFTPGKYLVGIRVHGADGLPASWKVTLLRWIGGFVDFYLTAGLGALLSIWLSDRQQRLGDRWARANLIRKK